jgi:hypothetical protein
MGALFVRVWRDINFRQTAEAVELREIKRMPSMLMAQTYVGSIWKPQIVEFWLEAYKMLQLWITTLKRDMRFTLTLVPALLAEQI